MYQKDQGSRGKYRFNMAVLIMLIFAVMAAGGVWMLTRATADTAVQNVQKVIYVTVDGGTSTKDGKSWETAYSSADLQTAITQSAASKDEAVEVWVKKGVYTRTATLSLDKGAKLYGGFAGNETTEASRDARDIANNKTTLKALEESDGQYEKFSVVTGGNGATSDDTRIDGFIISRGQGNYADDDRYTARGGGMYNNNSSPTITNCTFDSNVIGLTSNNSPTTKCYSYGGAMYNENSSPIVTNCTFENNTARGGGANGTGMRGSDGDGYGGAMYNSGGNPTVTNCTFDTNTASGGGGYPTVAPGNGNGYGGAMCNENSSTTVINCTFSKNNANGRNGDGKGYGGYGGAMYNVDGNQTVTNCTFSLNTTDYDCYGGGAMYNGGGSQTVTNCTFSQNTANYGGGGMYNSGGSQTVTNCTFSHNGTKKDGGGMYNSGGSQTVTNCTFSGNWAHTDGGGAVCTNSKEGNTAIIVNSIFWDNSAINTSADRQEIYNPAGTLIIQNCVVSGDFNLASGGSSKDISNGDPMIFAVDKVMNATESAADTYMFIISGDNAQASSALGKGLAVGKHEIAGKPVNVPSTDQCGRVRLQDKVDIGAYQYNADRTVDGVSLTPTAVALLAGETTKLTATVTPAIAANKTVIWTTSDAETASVADGTVTAHKVGTAVITVTTQDGGKTAACTVTVSAANEKEAAKPATPPAKPENAPDNVTATSGPVEVIYVQPGATDEEKENAITEAAGKLEGITSKDLEATGSTVKIKEDLAKKLAEGILGKELSKDTVVPLPVFTAVCGAADGKVLMAAFEMTGSSFLADKPENAQFLKILSGDTAEFLGYVSKAEDFADGKFTVMTMDDAIFTGEFAADTTYKLVVFIKDGGKYDMDAGSERNEDGSKKPNGRIADPLAIIKTGASPTPTPNHNGGSGCNSGAFGSGMALLALCLPMLIKRRKR